VEEEISLFDIFEVFSRRKKLMWIVFIVVVGIGIGYAGYSRYFFKTYEAVATMMVNPVIMTSSQKSDDAYENLLNTIIQYPEFTKETYLALISSSAVIEPMIEKLNLPSNEYTVESMKENFKAEYLHNTNLIKITVRNANPKLASDIANTWGSVFEKYINDSVKEHFDSLIALISLRVEGDRKDLEKAKEEIEVFTKNTPCIEEIQKEVSERVSLLVNYQNDLINLDMLSKTQENQIKKTKEYLEKESQFIELQKSVLDYPLFMGYMSSIGKTTESLSLSLKSQEINQYYYNLSKKLSDLDIDLVGSLSRKAMIENSGIIQTLKSDIVEKEALIRRIQSELEKLEKHYEVLFRNYSASYMKLDELKTAASIWTGSTNITTMSKAIPPTEPISDKSAKLILAVSAVAGLFISVFLAFFVDFLDKLKQYQKHP